MVEKKRGIPSLEAGLHSLNSDFVLLSQKCKSKISKLKLLIHNTLDSFNESYDSISVMNEPSKQFPDIYSLILKLRELLESKQSIQGVRMLEGLDVSLKKCLEGFAEERARNQDLNDQVRKKVNEMKQFIDLLANEVQKMSKEQCRKTINSYKSPRNSNHSSRNSHNSPRITNSSPKISHASPRKLISHSPMPTDRQQRSCSKLSIFKKPNLSARELEKRENSHSIVNIINKLAKSVVSATHKAYAAMNDDPENAKVHLNKAKLLRKQLSSAVASLEEDTFTTKKDNDVGQETKTLKANICKLKGWVKWLTQENTALKNNKTELIEKSLKNFEMVVTDRIQHIYDQSALLDGKLQRIRDKANSVLFRNKKQITNALLSDFNSDEEIEANFNLTKETRNAPYDRNTDLNSNLLASEIRSLKETLNKRNIQLCKLKKIYNLEKKKLMDTAQFEEQMNSLQNEVNRINKEKEKLMKKAEKMNNLKVKYKEINEKLKELQTKEIESNKEKLDIQNTSNAVLSHNIKLLEDIDSYSKTNQNLKNSLSELTDTNNKLSSELEKAYGSLRTEKKKVTELENNNDLLTSEVSLLRSGIEDKNNENNLNCAKLDEYLNDRNHYKNLNQQLKTDINELTTEKETLLAKINEVELESLEIGKKCKELMANLQEASDLYQAAQDTIARLSYELKNMMKMNKSAGKALRAKIKYSENLHAELEEEKVIRRESVYAKHNLSNTVKALTSTINDRESEINHLTKEFEDLKTQYKELLMQRDNAVNEIEILETQTNDLVNKNLSMKEELQLAISNHSRCSEAEKKIEEYSLTTNELKKEIENLKIEHELLQKQTCERDTIIRQQKEEIHQINKIHKSIQQTTLNEQQLVIKQKEEIIEEFHKLKASNIDYETKFKQLSKEKSWFHKQMNLKQNKLMMQIEELIREKTVIFNNMHGQIKDLEIETNRLASAIKTRNNEITDLHALINDQENKIQEIEILNENHMMKCKELVSSQNEKDKEITDLHTLIDDKENKIREIETANENHIAEYKELVSSQNQKDKEITNLHTLIDDKENKIREIEKLNENHMTKYKEIQANEQKVLLENQELLSENQDLQLKNNELNIKINSANKSLSKSKHSHAKLKNNLMMQIEDQSSFEKFQAFTINSQLSQIQKLSFHNKELSLKIEDQHSEIQSIQSKHAVSLQELSQMREMINQLSMNNEDLEILVNDSNSSSPFLSTENSLVYTKNEDLVDQSKPSVESVELASKCRSLKQEKMLLESEIAQLSKINRELAQENQTQIDLTQDILGKYNDLIAQIKLIIASSSEGNEHSSIEVSELSVHIKRIYDKNNELQSITEHKSREIASLEDTNKSLYLQVQELENEKLDLSKQFEHSQEKSNCSSQLQSEIESLRNEINELAHRGNQLNSKYQEISVENIKLKLEIDALKLQKDHLQKSYHEISETANCLATENQSLKAQLEEHDLERQDLQHLTDYFKAQMEDTSIQNDKLFAQLEHDKSEIRLLKATLTNQCKENEELLITLKSLESQLETKKTINSKLQETVDELVTCNKLLEKEMLLSKEKLEKGQEIAIDPSALVLERVGYQHMSIPTTLMDYLTESISPIRSLSSSEEFICSADNYEILISMLKPPLLPVHYRIYQMLGNLIPSANKATETIPSFRNNEHGIKRPRSAGDRQHRIARTNYSMTIPSIAERLAGEEEREANIQIAKDKNMMIEKMVHFQQKEIEELESQLREVCDFDINHIKQTLIHFVRSLKTLPEESNPHLAALLEELNIQASELKRQKSNGLWAKISRIL